MPGFPLLLMASAPLWGLCSKRLTISVPCNYKTPNLPVSVHLFLRLVLKEEEKRKLGALPGVRSVLVLQDQRVHVLLDAQQT